MKSACGICNENIDSSPLSCGRCKQPFHEKCAKPNANLQVWSCPNCPNFLNPPSAPKGSKLKSMTSKRSDKTHSSKKSVAEAQLKLLEQQELLLKKQAEEREAARNEKLRQIAEKEKCLKEQEEGMKQRHLEQQAILKKKSELLDTIISNRGSQTSESESSSVRGRDRVETWKTTFANDLQKKVNKQSTAVHIQPRENFVQPTDKNPQHANPSAPNFDYQNSAKQGATYNAHPLGNQQNAAAAPPGQNLYNASLSSPLVNISTFAGIKESYELPKFDGSAKQWPVFISKFRNTAHAFTADVNLVRLQNCLVGAARYSVRGLLDMPNNVVIIIDTLRSFFGRPEFIINSLLDEVRKEHKPEAGDFDALISFALQVRNICSTMQAAELNEHLCNPTLLQELIDKLPSNYKESWAEHIQMAPEVNLETFSEWLYGKAMTLTSILTKPPQFLKKHAKASVNLHQESQNKYACMICSNACKSPSECEEFKAMSCSDRWTCLRKHDLCRCCLRIHKGRCRFLKPCGKDGCVYKHNPLLHSDKDGINTESTNAEVNSHSSSTSNVLFKIAPVILYGSDNKQIETFALMDDGSSVTLIEEELAKELDVKNFVNDPLCLKWTSDEVRDENQSFRFDAQIKSTQGNKMFELKNVRTVSKLQLPIQTLEAGKMKGEYPYLKPIPLTSYSQAKPRLLIGLDNSRLMLSSKSRSGGVGEPIAIKTSLGWIVYGHSQESSPRVFHACECKLSAENEMLELVKQFITMDNLAVGLTKELPISTEDQRAVDLMNSSTVFKNGRYECSLLWKYDEIKLPDSFNMALRRLQCLERKFKREPELKTILNEQIESYVRKGYAKLLSQNEVDSQDDKCWYLPIFVVKNPNKPKKIRVVWDAAASVNGTSLNSVLLKGPDLLASLPGVLMRFRERKWAITGDICEMFHQVQVKESDQHYQRFLWRVNPEDQPSTYSMKVMTFGATCSPVLAQHVKNFNAEKFKDKYPMAYNAIRKNHYVDDWLESVESEELAVKLAKEVKFIHSSGGFQMRHWISNSPKVMEDIGGEGELKNLDLASDTLNEKVLGMWWSLNTDSFTYSLRFNKGDKDVLSGMRIPSKRQLLRIIMSVYDPLGMLAHFMAYAKILMQLVWRKGIKWDEDISCDLQGYWFEWLKMLPGIEKLDIPRYYLRDVEPTPNSVYELHVFVDGSEEGYAAAAYLRVVSEENVVVCKLIAAKSRVAPLKHHSIPRLELLAAVLGVRLAHTIEKEHSIAFSRRYFWSDSRTVCSWIRSQHRRYKQYVACRIGEILELSNESEWQWLSTSENIADAATRMQLMDLSSDGEWFCGPKFLYRNELLAHHTIDESFQTDEEVRPCEVHQILLHHVGVSLLRFSNWFRLRRTIAFVFRYVTNCLAKSKNVTKTTGPLQQREFQAAERIILRQAQRDGYPDEIVELQTSSPPTVNKKSQIYKLLPFLDEHGILRHRGRLDEADFLTGDVKNPIILPYNHEVTDLIVMSYHRRFHHHNNETVVNEIRQKYHYPPIRKHLRQLRKTCQKCKNETAKPTPPVMANLPLCRFECYTRPFTHVGIDYFGPIVVCIGRRNEKRWGVLATCLTFRAIHLESVHSLTTSSCIMALRNFMNRRGQPRVWYSDNATTFKGASKELKQCVLALDRDALSSEFNSSEMSWQFNPPTAAHMGGAWERLIRSVKKNLYHITTLKNIQDELFRSLLIEVENVVNARPLTYVPIDCELSEALTPNHFLLGSSNGNKPSGWLNLDGSHLRKNWLLAQQLTEIFYKRFLKEILPELNRRSKWFESSKDMKVDDIVLVLDDNVPKYQFCKGRVLQVYPGRDGKVRSASVKTNKGVYDRPVTKLAILDVYQDESKTVSSEEATNFTVGSVTATQHPITDLTAETRNF